MNIIECIANNYCLAERRNHINCDDYVVWRICDDFSEVWSGNYFNSYESTQEKFISSAFQKSIKKTSSDSSPEREEIIKLAENLVNGGCECENCETVLELAIELQKLKAETAD